MTSIKELVKKTINSEYREKRRYERCFETLDEMFIKTGDIKYYVRSLPNSAKETPELYNEFGEKLKVCYMANNYLQSKSRYLFFDLINYLLDVHFYEGLELRKLVGNPSIRFGYIGESQLIDPFAYEYVYRNKDRLSRELDSIFSFDEKILNEYPNAKFFPVAAVPWYGNANFDTVNDNLYERKSKNISIIASNKCQTELHKKRVATARKCKVDGIADAYGWFDGGTYLEKYDDAFTAYRYAIVIENNVADYYFTEKLTSCFAAQTIPIYVGARKISEFFNEDGMIIIGENQLEDIDKIVSGCSERDYNDRIPAILDNYERVKKYDNKWDWWYRNYGNMLNN